MKALITILALLTLTGCLNPQPIDDITVDSQGDPYVEGDMALIEINGIGV